MIGDRREKVAAELLAAAGYETVTLSSGEQPEEGGFDALLFPLTGISHWPPPALSELKPGGCVLVGRLEAGQRDDLAARSVDIEDLLARDDFALLNAVPTAEGAIARAIELSDYTLHGSPCAVIGYGRTGSVLASVCASMGAITTVVARNSTQRAEARARGLLVATFDELLQLLERVRFVFNTVPAPVLQRSHLSMLPSGAVVVDLASAPGGTDFEAASELGISADLALGLPGRTAPLSAGHILAEVVLEVLAQR